LQDINPADMIPDAALESSILQFVPSIRSGSFSDIGRRRFMEDEHICIDDLSSHLGSSFKFPKPSALYGVINSLAYGCYDLKFDSCGVAFLR
jgi:protein phosphatase 2C family protein 2/3